MIDIQRLSTLANLTLTSKEQEQIAPQLEQTLSTIAVINELDTSKVLATSQVTPLSNRLREDVIDASRILSQEQALSNSSSTYKGFFKVKSTF